MTCVVIRNPDLVEEVEVDTSDMSPFTYQVLGGDVTILGSWNECSVIMLGLKHSDGPIIPETMIPEQNREKGPLRGPLMFTKLDETYQVVHFRKKDYNDLLL